MSKYFDTKPGSLEEAVSAAQQAAIAISKKEKGEKPKNEDQGQFSFVAAQAKKNGEKKFTFAGKEYETEKVVCPKCEGKGCDHCEGKGYHEEGFNIKEEVLGEDTVILDLEDDDKKLMADIKKMGIKVKKVGKGPGDGYAEYSLSGSKANLEKANKKLMLVDDDIMNFKETNKNDKSDDGDGLDAVQPKAVKKKFADRKDKDIDNDGDVDDSDKFLHKRRKAVSKAMGEEITQYEFEMMIEALTELSPALLKRARDAAKAKADKLDKRQDALSTKKGGGYNFDSKSGQKLAKDADKARDQEKKFSRGARDAGERDTEKAMQKGVLGKKGTSAKSVEKSRRKDAADAAGPGKEKGSVAGVDRNIQKGKDAYAKYQDKGGKLNRNDYMKRFGSKLKREDFETDLEFEAHLIELNRTMTPIKDTILNMWKEAQDVEQDKNGDGMDDDQKPKKTVNKSVKKTDSGKDMTEIETSVKMPKMKNEKNRV